MTVFDGLVVFLRSLTYVGSIAIAGAVLFVATFPGLTDTKSIRRQIVFGALLLILVEPARYFVFQMTAMGGDMSSAFGPDQRWIGMQTAFGKASLARFVAAVIALVAGRTVNPITAVAASALMGSFIIEGHTASQDSGSALLSVLLSVHLIAAHWWLGSLYPLRSLLQSAPQLNASIFEDFGRRAAWIVAILLIAGGLMIGSLVSWSIDPSSAYQQRFAFKIVLVGVLLSLAAANKLWLTPKLARSEDASRLRISIGGEMVVAFLILLSTAFAITVAPMAMTHG